MLNFELHLPTHLVFGKGVELETGKKVKELGGSHLLVHYGTGSVVRSGLLNRVVASLKEEGIQVELFGGAIPNPLDTLVYEGIELVRKTGVDFVLGVGGGSAIDSAKAIALGAPYDGDFWDFYSYKVVPQACIPVGVVLTLSGTGSESSNSSVITRSATRVKRGVNVEVQRPVLAIMNPELTYTLPPYQTAAGVTDIMSHILERYFTNTPDVEVTDRLCEGLLLTVIHAAKLAIREPDNYNARAQLMWAGTLAHNNLCGVGRQQDWACHAIEHELSGLYDVAHGAGLAVVTPAWMRYTMHHNTLRFAQLAERVWGCSMNYEHPEYTALEGIIRFEHFLRDIGMPVTLKELGAKAEDIPYLAAHTKMGNAGTHTGYFVPLTPKDVEKVLHLADK